MAERRKDDERFDKLISMTEKHGILLDQVHKSWFGVNNSGGYKTKIDKMETRMNIWSKIAGSSIGVAITALIKSFFGGT